jgi:hypothetical protein
MTSFVSRRIIALCRSLAAALVRPQKVRCYDDFGFYVFWSASMIAVSQSKLCTLSELAARVADGSALGLGGVFLHRGPFAFVRELARQKRRDLEIIKPSPGYDLDLLCRAGAVRRVRAGIVAMEGNFGLAKWYRKAIERKEAELEEHA